MTAPPGRNRAVVTMCTAAALVGFASNSLLTRAAVGPHLIDAVSFTTVRLIAGALALACLVRGSTRQAASDPARPPWAAGALALAGYAYFFAFAYTRIDAGTGALLLFGAVQLTMTGWGIRSGERPGGAEWAGLLSALVGLIILTRPGRLAPDAIGAVLMGAAGVCWGIYSLLGRQTSAPLARTFGNFAIAAVGGTLVLLLPLPLHITAHGATLAAISGAIASGLGYTVWYMALPSLSRFRAALVQLSVPVLTACGAWLALGEAVTARLVVSGCLILGGIFLAAAVRQR